MNRGNPVFSTRRFLGRNFLIYLMLADLLSSSHCRLNHPSVCYTFC